MKKFLIILFIFILAFSLRFIYVTKDEVGIEQDEIQYDTLAMQLLETKSYGTQEGQPTALRPPLYAAFLAIIYKVFGHSYFAVRLIQAILGAITSCLFFLIAEKIFNKKSVAVLTGVFCSVYMIFIFYTRCLLTETVFSFLLAAIVYLSIAGEELKPRRVCILGVLCGILTLVRSSGFFVPLIICIVLWVKRREGIRPSKKLFASFVMLFICFGFVLLPWTVRNYSVYKRFIPVSTNAGQNIYQSVKPAYGKIPEMGPRQDPIAEVGFSMPNEADRNDYFMKKAIEAYRENPKRAIRSFIIRFLFFWNIIDWNVTDGDVINYHFIFIFPFAFLGVVYALKASKDILAILLVILYFTSLVLVFQGAPRFRMPIDGYIIMLGSYGICEFINRRKNKIYPLLSSGGYFLFTYFLYKYSLQTKYFIKGLMEKLGLWW